MEFYIFRNHFCDDKYEIKEKKIKCFNINQLGFESIDFIDNNSKISILDENRNIQEKNCIEDEVRQFDILQNELKNKLLDNAKQDYKECKNQIISDYRDDDYLYRHKNDICVKKRTYGLKHCNYKNCNNHNESCKYEKDKKEINKYLDVLDVNSYNDLDLEKMFL